jgi:hypothetical protein
MSGWVGNNCGAIYSAWAIRAVTTHFRRGSAPSPDSRPSYATSFDQNKKTQKKHLNLLLGAAAHDVGLLERGTAEVFRSLATC